MSSNRRPRQWQVEAALPICAGYFWLTAGSDGWWLWAAVPGALLLASGVALLLWAGDRRINQYMAAGGLVGMVMMLPAMLSGGFVSGLVAGALSALSFLLAGRLSLGALVLEAPLPTPENSAITYANVALDEALMAYFIGSASIPSGDKADTVCKEVVQAQAVFAERGWLKHPERAHQSPEAPSHQRVDRRSVFGRDFEVLRFASEFPFDTGIPGAERWASYHRNEQACAWVLRHTAETRPWLVCIHGYRMGMPWMDFPLFDPHWLHERLGFNLLMPVLPLHGPRRHGWRSGDEYLDGDFLDIFHAQSQALWDLRRSLAWLRMQEDHPSIGVYGISLGGYNAGLLSQYESGLDFVVAGVPVTDFSVSLWGNIPVRHRDYYQTQGVDAEAVRQVLQPVSPLARPSKVAQDRRFVFAGSVDRVVTPDQADRLAQHWGVETRWYPGSHLSFRGERVVQHTLFDAATAAGWAVNSPDADPV